MWGKHSGLCHSGFSGFVREDVREVPRGEEVGYRLCVKYESLSDVGKSVGDLRGRCCLGGGHGDIDRVHFGFSGFAPAISADKTVDVNAPVGVTFARAKYVVMRFLRFAHFCILSDFHENLLDNYIIKWKFMVHLK